MGGLVSKLSWYRSNKDVRILMCGLDAAGKTTILYRLKFGEFVTKMPTFGFNPDIVEYKGVNFVTWDVKGGSEVRTLWRHYTANCDGIIFVVDSTDRDRVSECHDELHQLLEDENLKDTAPLLVFANKQDVSTAMNANEIKCHLKLEGLQHPYRKCFHKMYRHAVLLEKTKGYMKDWTGYDVNISLDSPVVLDLIVLQDVQCPSHRSCCILVHRCGGMTSEHV